MVIDVIAFLLLALDVADIIVQFQSGHSGVVTDYELYEEVEIELQ